MPAGAFDSPTLVASSASTKPDFSAVPSFDHDLTYATSVQLNFDGVAQKRLDIELPIPAGLDPARTFYLGYLGQSVRGPRVMIVDTLRVSNGRFTTAPDPNASSGSSSRAIGLATSVGADVKNALLGITHSGTYAAVEINTGGASLAWGVIEGLEGGVDLFWSGLDALYAASFYLTEGSGRAAIPLLNNKQKFEVVGVDASTGLTAFSKVYDPLPDGGPGAVVVVANPNPDTEGPYPVSASPFRIETLKLDAEEVEAGVRNFAVRLQAGFISAKDSDDPLPSKLQAALFNANSGELDEKRSDGLKVGGTLHDRVALFIEQEDVDPSSSLSVAFSKKIYLGGSDDPADIDKFLSGILVLQSSRDPDVEPFADVPDVHYRADSAGQRVLIDLPASLQRGYAYQLLIKGNLATEAARAAARGCTSGRSCSRAGSRRRVHGAPIPRPRAGRQARLVRHQQRSDPR